MPRVRPAKAPATLPDIVESTRDYERRLAKAIPVIKADLAFKHEAMTAGVFPFLRATCYHWASRFPVECHELTDAPVVLSVGDLHVENYGSWRDAEGRLIWGVNDFDEAFPLPYTQDLVRLATSARLAPDSEIKRLSPNAICAAILAGYVRNLLKGGEAVVLEERNARLRRAVYGAEREPVRYWEKISGLPEWKSPPAEEKGLLVAALPEGAADIRFLRRRAGLGSLGRPRVTALAVLGGSYVAREVKPLIPSAYARGSSVKNDAVRYADILKSAVRIPDPFLRVRDNRVLRRLSPHCSRIELAELDRLDDREKLLDAMGRELANIHLGTKGGREAILRDLANRKDKWLSLASGKMAECTLADWKTWKSR